MDTSEDRRWLASAGADGVLIWDLASGEREASFPSISVHDVVFDRERGTLFACGDDGLFRLSILREERIAARTRLERMSVRQCLGIALDPTAT